MTEIFLARYNVEMIKEKKCAHNISDNITANPALIAIPADWMRFNPPGHAIYERLP